MLKQWIIVFVNILIAVSGSVLHQTPPNNANIHHTNRHPYPAFYFRPVAKVHRDVDRIYTDIGETSLPYYLFFQFVLRTVKKARRRYLPGYSTGRDISSFYTHQVK